MPDQTQVEKIAKSFSMILKLWLGTATVREIARLNATASYAKACATHDFCDPNEAMLRAFEINSVTHPAESEDRPNLDIWDAAWEIARQNQFYVNEEE